MSVTRPVLLTCDECGEVSETVMGTTYGLREARRTARRYGWMREGRLDFCRPCTAGIRLGVRVTQDPDGSLWTLDGNRVEMAQRGQAVRPEIGRALKRKRGQSFPLVTCPGIDGTCQSTKDGVSVSHLYSTIVTREGQPNQLVDVCGSCFREKRSARPEPCSTCGAVNGPIPHLSRWWYVDGSAICRTCLRPKPGCCIDCIALPAWMDLVAGRVPIPATDCDCWLAARFGPPGQMDLALCV